MSFKVIFIYRFIANSFTDLLAPNVIMFKLIQIFKKQNVILFAQTRFRD